MTLIDHILVSHKLAPIMAPIELENLPDLRALKIYKKIFTPIIESRLEEKRLSISFHQAYT
jgi:hypothetical protein